MDWLKIEVLSQRNFNDLMVTIGVNDDNVDGLKDSAFISIIGTDECLKYYLHEEDTEHYFNDTHKNVLNLEFDDLSRNFVYDGHVFKAMNMEQAEKAVDFIERNVDNGVKNIYIHCRAGKSRSRAFAEFISRIYEGDVKLYYLDREDYTNMLNQDVLRKLSHAYWKKHKMHGYEDGKEYLEDLIEDI